ncbi:MAG: prenyltransferase/squalene oxidase repeat-containing protein [Candidatus Brocadiia bacterium]
MNSEQDEQHYESSGQRQSRLFCSASFLPALIAFVFAIGLGMLTLRRAEAQKVPALPEMITPETKAAIDRGMSYLARTQSRNGSWRAQGAFSTQTGYPCVMTSLAGLALAAGGNTPIEGKYAKRVRQAADYILKRANRTGLIAGMRNTSRPMYGHGFSMLFLAEIYGMEPNPTRQKQIRNVLQKAVQLTSQAQSKDGGWYYTPDSHTDEGSVTVTQIQGLRACRNAGVKVPKSTIDKATTYIQKCQQKDGGIAYRLGMNGSRPAITAAAVATMYNAGEYENPVAHGALKFTLRHVRKQKKDPWQAYRGHSYYGMLYASQAVWFSGDQNWQDLFPQMRSALLKKQQDDGSWQGDNVGRVYGTAVALLILQLPNQYLPILQR